jgi:hypothetical protein
VLGVGGDVWDVGGKRNNKVVFILDGFARMDGCTGLDWAGRVMFLVFFEEQNYAMCIHLDERLI